MTTEEMLVRLPCLTEDKKVAYYGTEYCPNLYPYDEEWHCDWIHCEEGDYLVYFTGDTPYDAVKKAFDYIWENNIPLNYKTFEND